jgi:hypothetical protein
MNRVFLAQVGGSIPPARVTPSGSQASPPPENSVSLTSRLLGWFGWKSTPQTQVASVDSTTLERGAHSTATGSILAPKIKSAPQGYTVASADPNEPYTNEPKNDPLEMQQTFATLPMPPPQQAATPAMDGMLPPEPADTFESRWSGLQKAEAGLAFNARWVVDSK